MRNKTKPEKRISLNEKEYRRRSSELLSGYVFKKFKRHLGQKKQEKAWLKGDYRDFNTFSEKYEQFVSSCAYIIKWNLLSEKQRSNLRQLRDMIVNYDDMKQEKGKILPKNDKEIYCDPKWEEIRDFASKVYEQLKELQELE